VATVTAAQAVPPTRTCGATLGVAVAVGTTVDRATGATLSVDVCLGIGMTDGDAAGVAMAPSANSAASARSAAPLTTSRKADRAAPIGQSSSEGKGPASAEPPKHPSALLVGLGGLAGGHLTDAQGDP
jgi:hypothetical protein